jgi:hypothetical protein
LAVKDLLLRRQRRKPFSIHCQVLATLRRKISPFSPKVEGKATKAKVSIFANFANSNGGDLALLLP